MSKKLDKDIFEKIDNLDQRISKVRTEYEDDLEKREGGAADKESPESIRGRLAGSMFLGNIIAGFILGFLADKFLGIAPWGLMLCILLGFAGGIYRAQDLMKKNE